MKVVFIQPKCGFDGNTWESLSVGYMGAYLKEHFMGDLDLKFFSAFYDTDEEIFEESQDADVIGITCTSPQYKHGLALAKKIKSKSNTVVLGGSHISAMGQVLTTEKSIDSVVVGEGEQAILDIVKAVDNGHRVKKVMTKPYIQNLDSIPFPDRELIKNERNISQAYKDNGIRITSVLSSRGCPYMCSFCCSKNVWGKTVRYRSPNNVLDEIAYLVDTWKIDYLKFADDTFTVNRSNVKEFCKEKVARGLNVPFGANAHINTITKELIEDLVKANCTGLWFGVESGSEKILGQMHKNTNVSRIKKIFALVKDYGIETRAYFLLGTPKETMEDIRKTEELCEAINPDIVGFTLLCPYPKNEYYESRMENWDWSEFNEYSNEWQTKERLPDKVLKEEQNRLLSKFAKKVTFQQKVSCPRL